MPEIVDIAEESKKHEDEWVLFLPALTDAPRRASILERWRA